jgi:hypothetical protein
MNFNRFINILTFSLTCRTIQYIEISINCGVNIQTQDICFDIKLDMCVPY